MSAAAASQHEVQIDDQEVKVQLQKPKQPRKDCFFGSIQPETIQQLHDGRSWRERTTAIETIERLLNESVQERDAQMSKAAKASYIDD